MSTLYELIFEFWFYWFPTDGMLSDMVTANTWIVWVLTVGLLLLVFVYPWTFLFRRSKRWRK